MSIGTSTLDRIARDYVAGMTSIRGRRVHRLILRELRDYDDVRAVGRSGERALIASSDDGRSAACETDGRGSYVIIARARTGGKITTRTYDLKKDSLPLIPAGSVAREQRERAAAALRKFREARNGTARATK